MNQDELNLETLKEDLSFFNTQLNKKIRNQNLKIKYFSILNGIALIFVILFLIFNTGNETQRDFSFKIQASKHQK